VKKTFFVAFLHQNVTFTFTISVFANLFFYEVLHTPNAKIGKLPLFFMLRFVKLMFSFWGFSNFCFQFVSCAYSTK